MRLLVSFCNRLLLHYFYACAITNAKSYWTKYECRITNVYISYEAKLKIVSLPHVSRHGAALSVHFWNHLIAFWFLSSVYFGHACVNGNGNAYKFRVINQSAFSSYIGCWPSGQTTILGLVVFLLCNFGVEGRVPMYGCVKSCHCLSITNYNNYNDIRQNQSPYS